VCLVCKTWTQVSGTRFWYQLLGGELGSCAMGLRILYKLTCTRNLPSDFVYCISCTGWMQLNSTRETFRHIIKIERYDWLETWLETWVNLLTTNMSYCTFANLLDSKSCATAAAVPYVFLFAVHGYCHTLCFHFTFYFFVRPLLQSLSKLLPSCLYQHYF